MFLLDEENLCNTIIAGNKDLVGNNIQDSRDSVLSFLHLDIFVFSSGHRAQITCSL